MSWLNDVLDFIFPKICICCKRFITQQKGQLCLSCLQSLEISYQKAQLHPQSIPYGLEVVDTITLYSFDKSEAIQRLMHRFKYGGSPELYQLFFQPFIELKIILSVTYDWVLPVPLHPKKEQKRGYNQTKLLAKQVAEELGTEYRDDLLKRVVYSQAQATKDREARTSDLVASFSAIYQPDLVHKHVLIIDDVLTTGTTLRACVEAFKKSNPDTFVHLLVIAASMVDCFCYD